MTDVDDLIAGFVSTRPNVTPGTRGAYGDELRSYVRWASVNGVDPLSPTASQIADYRNSLQRAYTPQTAGKRFNTVRRFFDWLHSERHIEGNPWAEVARMPWVRNMRPGLSLAEARRLIHVEAAPRQKAEVGLFLVNCLRAVEVCEAKVTDLDVVDGYPILRLPRRSQSHALDYTVLPPMVANPLHEHVADRTRGPLLITSQGAVTQSTVTRDLRTLGERAGITGPVSPAVLSTTMRELALREGFSFAELMRADPAVEMRDLARKATRADFPVSRHASLRMARLLSDDLSSTDALLGQAERAIHEPDTHPATAVMVAGATLERHLREMAARHEVRINDPKHAKITTYAAQLRAHGLLTEQEVQAVASVAADRDKAAHGWFDLITPEMARAMTAQVRAFVARRHL